MKEMKKAVIVAYGRTPITKARKGSFAEVNPYEYAEQCLNGILDKLPQLPREQIDDLVVGCAGGGSGELPGNISRFLVARAHLPISVPGQSVNRLCSSSLQAVATCANAIMAGQAQVMIAGGIEFMSSKVPMPAKEFNNKWLTENYPSIFMPMGLTAEIVAERYGITRLEMDQAAVDSNRKAYAAQQSGALNRAIIPIKVTGSDGVDMIVTQDEGIRPNTTLEDCAGLKTPFLPPEMGGKVTAASSSQTSDGASFAVLMSAEKAVGLGIKPIAEFIGFSAVGCEPDEMGVGPVYAVQKVMELTGMSLGDMDVIELNEAFASQMLYCIKKLGINPDKVNPWGGAMALGHPMGATGVFLLSKALDYLILNGGKYALVTMCIGGGMGAAGIFKMC